MFRNSKSAGKRFFEFSQTEASSRLDLLIAANATDDPQLAAKFIRHATDEARHAREFVALARSKGCREVTQIDHSNLYDRLGPDAFVAFVLSGERKGLTQFEAYAEHFRRTDASTASRLDTIANDESAHVAYTQAILSTRANRRRAIFSSRLNAAYWRFRRLGNLPASHIFEVLTTVLYVLASPYALALRGRFVSGWRDRSGTDS